MLSSSAETSVFLLALTKQKFSSLWRLPSCLMKRLVHPFMLQGPPDAAMNLDLDHVLVSGTQTEHVNDLFTSAIGPLPWDIESSEVGDTVCPQQGFTPTLDLRMSARDTTRITNPQGRQEPLHLDITLAK